MDRGKVPQSFFQRGACISMLRTVLTRLLRDKSSGCRATPCVGDVLVSSRPDSLNSAASLVFAARLVRQHDARKTVDLTARLQVARLAAQHQEGHVMARGLRQSSWERCGAGAGTLALQVLWRRADIERKVNDVEHHTDIT